MSGPRQIDAEAPGGPPFAGKFRLVREIGRGGMGVVYEAENVSIGRRTALKVLAPTYARTPEALARFEREARAAARIGHPNIVDVLDMGVSEDGSPYMVLELLDGEDLRTLLEREGCLAPGAAAGVARQILDALEAAHAAGIVHRDLKPDNVFLTRRGERKDWVKVIDFGIARIHDAQAGSARLTLPGLVVGTPGYASPEQVADRALDGRSDLYSSGVILYEMLSGKKPYPGDDWLAVVTAIVSTDPRPLREIAPWVPAELAAVVARAMARSPEDRFQTASEFAQALEPFLEAPARGVRARIDTMPVVEAPPPPPRSRLPWLMVPVAAIAIGAVTLALRQDAPPRVHRAESRAEPAPRVARPAEPESGPLVSVDVLSGTPGARVLLDGRELGTAPVRVLVPRADGSHTLRVEADGHEAQDRAVDLDHPVRIAVELRPLSHRPEARRRRASRGRGLTFGEDVY